MKRSVLSGLVALALSNTPCLAQNNLGFEPESRIGLGISQEAVEPHASQMYHTSSSIAPFFGLGLTKSSDAPLLELSTGLQASLNPSSSLYAGPLYVTTFPPTAYTSPSLGFKVGFTIGPLFAERRWLDHQPGQAAAKFNDSYFVGVKF